MEVQHPVRALEATDFHVAKQEIVQRSKLRISSLVSDQKGYRVSSHFVYFPENFGVYSLEDLITFAFYGAIAKSGMEVISGFFHDKYAFGYVRVTSSTNTITVFGESTNPTRFALGSKIRRTPIHTRHIDELKIINEFNKEIEDDRTNLMYDVFEMSVRASKGVLEKINPESDEERIILSLFENKANLEDIASSSPFLVEITYTTMKGKNLQITRQYRDRPERLDYLVSDQEEVLARHREEAFDLLFGDSAGTTTTITTTTTTTVLTTTTTTTTATQIAPIDDDVFNVLFDKDVGCRGIEFGKSINTLSRKVGKDDLFNPPEGVNCVYACFSEIFKLVGEMDKNEKWSEKSKTQPGKISFADVGVACLSAKIFLNTYVYVSNKGSKVTIGDDSFDENQVEGYFKKIRTFGFTATAKIHANVLINEENENDVHMMLFLSTNAPSKKLCFKCSGWVIDKSHFVNCRLCKCGATYQVGGKHFLTCRAKQKVEEGHLTPDVREYSEKNWKTGQYFADIETAVIDGVCHQPYCLCFSLENGSVKAFYGKECVVSFLKFLSQNTSIKGTIWFHNGGRFDFQFILDALVKHEKEVGYFGRTKTGIEIVSKGSRVITFSLTFGHKNNKRVIAFKDTLMFLPSSLKQLCEDYGVKKIADKGEFDHNKIKTWDDVEKHRAEAIKYCSQDVRCLYFVYCEFQKAFWDVCPMPICESVSLSSHAFAIWRRLMGNEVSSVYIPSDEIYEICRSAYRGGRVMATRQLFKTFDTDEYLKMYDVISLYPTVMFQELYPTGVPEIREYKSVLDGETAWIFSGDTLGIWCIDIECPKNVHLAFLMTRDEFGNSHQDLSPKKEIWVTSVEIHECIKLGYKVTRYHKSVIWPSKSNLFKGYIELFFNLKQAASGNKKSAKYQIAKLAMNSLSGKFGQKKINRKKKLYHSEGEFKIGEDVLELEYIFDEALDNILGVFETSKSDQEHGLPTQLSVFILGYSRVYMSKIFDQMGAYTDPECNLLYTDTDSVIVTKKAADKLQPLVGKNLGDLEDEFPNLRIDKFVAVAPKMYGLRLRNADDDKFYKIRMKGIPHRGDVFKQTSLMLEEKSQAALLKEKVELNYRGYYIRRFSNIKERKLISASQVPNITTDILEEILYGDIEVQVVFGSFKVSPVESGTKKFFTICPKWITRGVGVNSWWKKSDCPRVSFSKGQAIYYDYTYPFGYGGEIFPSLRRAPLNSSQDISNVQTQPVSPTDLNLEVLANNIIDDLELPDDIELLKIPKPFPPTQPYYSSEDDDDDDNEAQRRNFYYREESPQPQPNQQETQSNRLYIWDHEIEKFNERDECSDDSN